jgi:hypothetical protein
VKQPLNWKEAALRYKVSLEARGLDPKKAAKYAKKYEERMKRL